MKLDKEMVAKVAHLSRLEVSNAEVDTVLGDMNKILTFMEKLNELDTEGVSPLVYMNEAPNTWREDVLKQDITHEEALSNAPDQDGEYFMVPKVIAQPIK